jgi:hypothetical protein
VLSQESATALVPSADTLSVQLSGRDQQRVANKNTLQQIRSIYVKLDNLPAMCTAIGSVFAMVPSRYAPRAYKNNDGSAYSVYTDLAVVKPDGRYIKLYIAVDGVVEALKDRLYKGKTMTTMRMQLEPEHHTLLEELAERVKQELMSDEARSRLRQIALDKKNPSRSKMRCTFGEYDVDVADAAWLDYDATSIWVHSVNDEGRVLRPPSWFKKRPVNTPAYEGLPVSTMRACRSIGRLVVMRVPMR